MVFLAEVTFPIRLEEELKRFPAFLVAHFGLVTCPPENAQRLVAIWLLNSHYFDISLQVDSLLASVFGSPEAAHSSLNGIKRRPSLNLYLSLFPFQSANPRDVFIPWKRETVSECNRSTLDRSGELEEEKKNQTLLPSDGGKNMVSVRGGYLCCEPLRGPEESHYCLHPSCAE